MNRDRMAYANTYSGPIFKCCTLVQPNLKIIGPANISVELEI